MFNHGGTNRAYRLIWNRAKGRWTVAPERARGRGMAVTAVSALALLAPFGAAQAADPGALPSGGQVASGQITIGTSGNAMVIDQATARGIVNWQSFDVGSDASVTFRQPDAASVTLNRVTGGNGSTIAGTVNANGKVYIINPNGVLFSKGARVDVGGLVASTAGISDQDFLAGTDRFVSDGATGLVVNEGEITARDGGAVVLIGGTVVSNKGSIRADGGDAVLAAGATMLLDAGANGHLKIEVDGATTATLVENGGLIAADGGRILLRAEAANAAISSVVSNTGTLEANTMGTETGRILLLADMEGGQVKAGGSMTAAAPNGGDGGFIETSAATVTLADDLEVSTLAVDGGKSGEWLIDPYDVVITNTTQNGISENTSGNPFVLTPTGTGATIDSSKISTYLNSTSVTISTVGAGSEAGNITVNSAVSWNQANTLTLKADATTGGIIFNADINGSNGSSGLVLEAGAGGITQAGGTAITVGTIKATVSNGGSVDLSNTTNSISNLAASTAAGSFALTSNKALTLAGALTTNGAATLRATSGYITIDAPLVDNNANADIKLLAAAGININQDISLTGANAKLALNYNTILNYELRNGARLSVTGSAAGLTINGLAYTLVRNLTELQAVTSSNGNYALMADIDAAPTAGWNGGQGFAPINGFSNIFAGMGHTINGLTINRPGEATVGLFGLMSGTIRDLTVANVNVTGFGTVGGLVARLSGSSAALINTHVTGRVSSTGGLIGGLVGWSDQGNIVLSSSTAAVSGGSEVGGLVGRNRAANIANAYATGAVTGTGTGIGGLIGTTVQGSDVQTSYASGKVTGPGAGIGGLIGAVDATAITVTNSYWDIDTTGQTVSASGGTGISTANARTQATYAGFDFTNYWTMIAGQTRPVLRNEYAKVIYTPTSLQLARLNLAASYRLGADIDLTSAFTADASGNYASIWGAGGFVSLGDNSTPFTGTFNGQDHKITGLTVNRTGSNYIGLFGYTNGATVSNINLSGGSVSANSSVGALIGYMLGGALTGSTASTTVNSTSAGESNAGGLVGTNAGGAISGSSASGAVTGDGYQVGGLVGYLASGGSITRSYATGNVTGTNSSNGYVGGLVGGNGYTGNDGGSISLSYATGNVTGAGGPVGGLVGHNEGSITNAYATGSVTGTGTATNIGGLVGVNFINGTITSAYSTGRVTGSTSFGGFLGYNNAVGSAITSSYWDTQTSGQSLGQGGGAAGSITGRTTAQLQGSLPVGFSSTNWGTGTNLYPYFTWNYATTPVAISGIVRNQTGVSALQNVTITALSNGVTLGSAITGDNGYYYILAPGGSLAASGTIAYINDNATDGASFSDSAGVNGVQGLDINGSVIRLTTAGSTLTGLQTNYLAALGSYTDGDINFLSRTGFDALTTGSFDVRLTATGSGGMMLDTNLTSGGGMVLDSTAALAINADRTLTASGGVMTINAPLAWNGAHSLNLVTANKNIALNNNITATGGTLTLSGDISTSSSMIEVNRFQLKAGTWQQVDAARPVFKISDLVLDAGTSFLRAASGAGSTISPYLIYDVAGLQGLGSAGLLTSQFKLANDIDASGAGTWNGGAGFQPIGTNASPFSGGLNGNSFSITGLIINRPAQDNIGLFGVLAAGGSLNDIRLINTNIIGRTHVGGAAGTNSGTIAGVAVTGSVTGRGTVTGGLIGDNMGSVTESFSTATVVGDGDMVGGLLGRNQGGSAAVTNAYSSGTVTGAADNVGGLIGWNEGAVSQTYASGTVSGGGTNIGGLLGNQVSGLLTNNFWALAGTGQSTGIGSTPSSPDVTGLTAADMTKASSYTTAGWTVATNGGSASPWRIYDGNTAPLLRRFMTALSITGGTASKSYDGSANNSGVGTLTYSVTLYDATQVLGTASYIANSANAGTYNAANLALVGLYSTQFGYDIQAIGGTLTIDRTALTVAVNNATKTYDSLAYSGGNGVTYTGFVNGETAAVLGGTLAYGGTA
ncbi:filamentous hemagglutinin N-terminal domain-containing protein, partial [Niveispirillum irakense]|uniref:two-partner secretion domain-containing protein n=1 Tax=Niveispirillum irakense TaxID=34011 RepID=UPI000491C929